MRWRGWHRRIWYDDNDDDEGYVMMTTVMIINEMESSFLSSKILETLGRNYQLFFFNFIE